MMKWTMRWKEATEKTMKYKKDGNQNHKEARLSLH